MRQQKKKWTSKKKHNYKIIPNSAYPIPPSFIIKIYNGHRISGTNETI